MLFEEIYSSYYNAVAAILREAVAGTLTEAKMYELVQKNAFSESVLTIPANLKNGTWPLLDGALGTPLKHPPTMPLTTLQKRWLKSLLSDPRIRLFDPPAEGLEEVEPLYPADAFVYFDRYNNGDPYDDPDYVAHFRTVLTALREKRKLRIAFTGHRGGRFLWNCVPLKLEYSSKDDKFRLLTFTRHHLVTVNLGRVTECTLLEPYSEAEFSPKERPTGTLVLELTDERNALERVMLHFSHLEKETEKLDDLHYRLTLRYAVEDETELLIRVLSFGPMLKVTAPAEMIQKVRDRLNKQKKLRL